MADRPFAVAFSRPLGREVEASQYKPLRDFITQLARTQSGNLTVRVGSEADSSGLVQSAYIVMSEDEARDLYTGIADLFPEFRRGR